MSEYIKEGDSTIYIVEESIPTRNKYSLNKINKEILELAAKELACQADADSIDAEVIALQAFRAKMVKAGVK